MTCIVASKYAWLPFNQKKKKKSKHDPIIQLVEWRIGAVEASFQKFITGPNTDCCSEMPCSMYVWSSGEHVICDKKCTSQQRRHRMQVVCHPQLWFYQRSFGKSYLEENRYIVTRLNKNMILMLFSFFC